MLDSSRMKPNSRQKKHLWSCRMVALVIEDPKLEAALRKAIKKSTDTLMVSDFAQ